MGKGVRRGARSHIGNSPVVFIPLVCVCVAGGEKKIRENAVYVSGLADGVTEESLGGVFGAIGQIKVRGFSY